jgi:hypothetical protein
VKEQAVSNVIGLRRFGFACVKRFSSYVTAQPESFLMQPPLANISIRARDKARFSFLELRTLNV